MKEMRQALVSTFLIAFKLTSAHSRYMRESM